MKHRWKLDTAKMDLLPDGSAHGGAPSANNLAVARNLAPLGAESSLSVAGRGTWWPNLQQVGRGHGSRASKSWNHVGDMDLMKN